ncbi:MAG: hypothetical protein NTY86_11800 [Deltaproteobacteria bacterium]|nr:hypothetical protein [Deltaproteobacteria bacterium]
MTEKIVNIKNKNFLPDDRYLLEISQTDKFRYYYYSVVVYNKKLPTSDDIFNPPVLEESFNNMAPFSLYKAGIPITILKKYMSNKIDKTKLLSAREAFKQLKNFASQCCERISADLCCQVILQEIRDRKDNDLIIFIEKSASDKMLGRLATLQLSLTNIIICFLTYKPSDLMTIAMSKQTSKLRFDIHRLMSSNIDDFIGPYPGDSEDSLIQSYFYRPSPRGEGGDTFAPMRLDIFSQRLRLDEVESKKEKIKEIFLNTKDSYKDPNDNSVLPRLIPTGFDLLEGKLKDIEEGIKDRMYELRSKI